MKKINTIDLFAGCGGLMEGFEKEGSFNTVACVEWEKAPCQNLVKRLKTKWRHKNAEKEVIRFDIQRTDELINGYSDDEYGSSVGLNNIVDGKTIHLIIGGPPCQAYSLAGRIRDENGMKNDYRNYLFESYLRIVDYYKPNFFVFENVQGMLSASPNGIPITDEIKSAFNRSGYDVITDFNDAVFDLTEYGVPQKRKRIIILGVNMKYNCSQSIINDFYNTILPNLKCDKVTVGQAISDLPKLYPLKNPIKKNGKTFSHSEITQKNIHNHVPRFHNERDIKIFHLLAKDIKTGENQFTTTSKLKTLYNDIIGKESNVHKYYVLRMDEQSNTIPAHLYKDGLRHIHPDPEQMRSITVREAARLQTFDDDYEFIDGMMHQYKMIGNAVPPKFSFILAKAIKQIINKYGLEL